jgi:tetratricopeptide (TPR) repeat protein
MIFRMAASLVLTLTFYAAINDVRVAADSLALEALARGAERQLEEGRTTLDVQTLSNARKAFAECLRQDAKNAGCSYQLARTDSYLVRAEEYANHKDAVKRWLDTAIADAEHAVSLNDQSSNAHALLADLYGQKINGMITGMHYGPKANAEREKAFQRDPNNALAFAVAGRKYLYAPSMFGGDIDKAIESFQKATALDPQSDETFVWLAIAYHKKGDSAQAEKALAEAVRLNSRSVFAQQVKSQWAKQNDSQ